MIPYYVTYFILFAAEVFVGKHEINDGKRKVPFCTVAFIVLLTLFSLRHQSMGVDLGYYGQKMGYLSSFDYLNTHSWAEIMQLESFLNYEKGYVILNKLIGSIYNNRQFFMAVCSCISIFPVFNLIKRKSKLPLLSVVVFLGLPVFLLYFSGIRQGIAIAVAVYSVKFIEEKRLIPFILTVLFATLFHATAIVFLIAYPIYYIRLNDVWKLIFTIMIPIVYVFKTQLFNVLSKLLKDNAQTAETGAITLFIVFCLVYIYLIIMNKDSNEEQNGMINLFYLACICQAFGGIYQIAMRVGYYFMIYLVVALPNTVAGNKNRQNYSINYIIILLAFLIYGIYSIRNSTWAMAYPYYFFWEW